MKATRRFVLPGVIEVTVGALGSVTGVTAARGMDAPPVPAVLIATTETYDMVPFVNPLMVQVVRAVEQLDTTDPLTAALYAVAVYPVTVEPPLSDGASHETTAEALPPVAMAERGSDGGDAGVAVTAFETEPSPTSLTPRMSTEYEVPFVRPKIVKGLFKLPASTHAPEFNWY